ncbi:MAG: hypothetical protein MUF34_13555 [Polyangiaceae bacterium]|jgi:hypothetical protein|nr:hypothetical protein [Polyangiaceae bacterium]
MVRLARLLGLLLLPLASTLAPVEARAQGAPPTAQPASGELAEAARLVAEAND